MNRAFVTAVLILAGLVGAAWAAQTMSVQVKDGQVRQKPHFLSPLVATLHYGDRVEVVGEDGPWRQITARPDVAGYVHISALTAKEVVLTSGGKNVKVEASNDEVVLAGKGFNRRVEDEYRRKNSSYNYAAVDLAETGFGVKPGGSAQFLAQGGLKPQEKVVYAPKKTKPAEAEARGASDAP